MRSLLTACLILTAAPALAFEGNYVVQGGNPGNAGNYTGLASIAKNGDTYLIAWNVGGKVYRGVGIADQDVLAVSVPEAKQVVLYRKDKDGRLLGRWSVFGMDKAAPEVLVPRKAGDPAPAPQKAPPAKNGKPEKAT